MGVVALLCKGILVIKDLLESRGPTGKCGVDGPKVLLERLVKWDHVGSRAGIGAHGEEGDKGDIGSVGQQGPICSQANTGPRGVQGAKGFRGVDGI